MPDIKVHAFGLAAGAVTAAAHLRLFASQPTARRTVLAGAGLAVAAAVYPVSRERWRPDAAAVRELAGLAAYSAVGVAACRRIPPTGTRIAAAGWATHALFDIAHRHADGSRLPAWYPAACGSYDLIVAGHLLRSAATPEP